MKKKSKGLAPNKSLEIRKTAREMILEGKPPRPIEIIPRLKNKGITVSSAAVSTALRGTELALRQSRPKCEEIRDAARKLIFKGKPPRPIEILEILEAKGITVSSSQVSAVLRGTELAFRQSRSNWENMPPATSMPPLEDLFKAQDFVRNMGSLETAMNALSVFSLFKQEPTPEQEQYYGGA